LISFENVEKSSYQRCAGDWLRGLWSFIAYANITTAGPATPAVARDLRGSGAPSCHVEKKLTELC